MRLFVSTLLLSSTLAAGAAAQGVSTAPASSTPGGSGTTDGLLGEPRALTQAMDFIDRRWETDDARAKNGFYPDLSGPITGSGWIAVGPGYRHRLFNDHALVDGSATISWRAYKEAQARFELTDLASNHLRLGVQGRWQDFTQVDDFGRGSGSLESQRSEYAVKYTDVLGYGNLKTTSWLTIGGRFGWMQKPRLGSAHGPFHRDFPDALNVFVSDPGVTDPTSYLHGDVSVTVDTRDYPGHPTTGALYRASAAAFSDRGDLGLFSFRRYEAEGMQIVPLTGTRWLLALHAWGAFSNTSPGNEVPFYLLPSLGGQNTLRGYDDYRFHDRNLLLVSGESRWALLRHMDVAAFFDAGNVASRASDLNLRKTSYGVGARVHTRATTVVRLDVGHSTEGYQVILRLTDPFSLMRRNERNTVAPFVP